MNIISVQKPTAICCRVKKNAFRLAQLEERACAEWEAGDVTAQWCDHVDWDKVSSPLACSHEFFLKVQPTHFLTIHGYI